MSLGLLIDTSFTTLRVGLEADGKLIAKKEEKAFRKQSELLVPYIKSLLEQTGYKGNDITLVVAGKGPGSYTGVRIGLTVAKTVALALNVPLYLVSSLYLLKAGDQPTVCLMDARNKRSYMGVYEGDKVIMDDAAVANEEVAKVLSEHPEWKVGGDTAYLGIEHQEDDVFSNLLGAVKERYECDPLSARPSYLKEHYDVPHL